MSDDTFLGIDLGTTELKVVIVQHGAIAAEARVALGISRPRPGWSEQQPEEWIKALGHAMQQLCLTHQSALAALRAIGLSGQMHGAVLLDDAEQILRPAILWNDSRSHQECVDLTSAVPGLSDISGNLAMPGFTAPKLLWIRRHEPAIFARTARVLLPKDLLRLYLTGNAVTECSDASGTLWLDVAARRWSATVLSASGLSVEQMPVLIEGSEPSGTLRDDLAKKWGLRPGILVAGGGGDNAASAVGIGAVEIGQGFVSLGTSGVLFIVSDGFRPNPARALHAFCHALPNRWHQMSVMLSAASCLQWVMTLTGQEDPATAIDRALALSPKEREYAPIFLPYLAGERTPHNDPFASGVFAGLRHEHGAQALTYSALEGVCFGMLDGYRAFGVRNGPPPELQLVGGGSRSHGWARLMASVLQLPLGLKRGQEAAGAIGAARLAMLAAGMCWGEIELPDGAAGQIVEPDGALAELLAERYARFTSLYENLQPFFRTL